MRPFRIGLTTALGLYAIALLAAPEAGRVLDEINRPVHDAGHALFAPLGTTLGLLGGTILPLFLALMVGAWFTVQKDEHAASVAVWWVGQGFTTLGLTMANSSATLLPLPGADHDWSQLFDTWGVSAHAMQYGQLAHGFGVLVMLVATFWGIAEALHTATSSMGMTPRYRSMARR